MAHACFVGPLTPATMRQSAYESDPKGYISGDRGSETGCELFKRSIFQKKQLGTYRRDVVSGTTTDKQRGGESFSTTQAKGKSR